MILFTPAITVAFHWELDPDSDVDLINKVSVEITGFQLDQMILSLG